ncbi:MAG TPA: type II toxin-antitoxin system VapC family toxin [Terriglobales bacterium]|nr:type II toxin-antitoxin system VapC family toxin [Terriglobales bacterium]
MVIDSSALAAILLGEPEQHRFNTLIDNDRVRLISAATLVEISIVIEARKGELGTAQLDLLIRHAKIETVPVTVERAQIARTAYRNFGKGRHAAKLNFGDCFAYALAKATGEPLLCKGPEFGRTDLLLANTISDS